MATALYEAERTQTTAVNQEAELHNQQIRERYLRLQNAEALQFGEDTHREEFVVHASVLAPEKTVAETPVLEQAPIVTEYTRTRIESPVFTTEKFGAIERAETQEQAPVTMQTVAMPVQAPAVVAEIRTEAQYSLSNLAKAVIAAFAAVVVVMFALIGVNTQILNRKAVQLNALQQERAQIVARNAELERRIEIAQSEETIREFAESKGMILGDE